MFLIFWYFDSQLTTLNLDRNYCSFFMLKNTFVLKREDFKNWWRCWYTRYSMLLLIKWIWYIWLLQKHSYSHFVEICVIHLWNFINLIYWKILLLLKQFSSLGTDLPCHVGFSFFDFLIPITTETTHNSCPFEFKCSIQSLTKIVT